MLGDYSKVVYLHSNNNNNKKNVQLKTSFDINQNVCLLNHL